MGNQREKSDLSIIMDNIDEILKQCKILEALLDDPSISEDDKDKIGEVCSSKADEALKIVQRISNKSKKN